jgi:hypothetical protein
MEMAYFVENIVLLLPDNNLRIFPLDWTTLEKSGLLNLFCKHSSLIFMEPIIYVICAYVCSYAYVMRVPEVIQHIMHTSGKYLAGMKDKTWE